MTVPIAPTRASTTTDPGAEATQAYDEIDYRDEPTRFLLLALLEDAALGDLVEGAPYLLPGRSAGTVRYTRPSPLTTPEHNALDELRATGLVDGVSPTSLGYAVLDLDGVVIDAPMRARASA